MKSNFVTFVAGVLFAVGLGISGMTQPEKVVGFLDFSGAWDASLMMVMVGGIGVNTLAYHLIAKRRAAPLLRERWELPSSKDIDPKLIAGAAVFGVGWGLGGFCPGPGIVSVASGSVASLVFVGAMIVGMLVYSVVAKPAPRADA